MNNELKNKSLNYKSWTLRDRQIYDLEMILNGGFSPLGGFLNKQDYECVISDMRLKDGSLWPIPVTLDVDKKFSELLHVGDKVTLKDQEGFSIAVIEIEDIWEPDFAKESATLAQSSILNQSALAMVAQANNAMANILTLLQ